VRPLTFSILFCVVAATPARADGASQLVGPTAAALEALRGHPKQARAMLTSRKDDPADPAALVVLASIALDEGDVREATRVVRQLRTIRPDAPEGRRMDALIAERTAHPGGDWVAAGLAALQKVPPVFGGPAPLLDVGQRILEDYLAGKLLPFPEDAARALPPADAFLARWAWPRRGPPDEALVREAIRLVRGDERPLVLLAVLDVLDGAEGAASLGAEVAGARAQVVAKLRNRAVGGLRAAAVPRRPDTEPIGDNEVRAIEAAVAGEFPPTFGVHYRDLLAILEKLDPATAPSFAMSGAVGLVVPPPFLLNLGDRVMRGGISETAREPLAAALVRLADSQLREGTFLTDMLAAMALSRAGDLRRDPTLSSRASAIRREADALRDAHRCIAPLLRLPIRGLHKAWANEVPRERALAQQAARLGISCPEPTVQQDESPKPNRVSPCPDPEPAADKAR
jgi:hypothetical protein